MTDELMAAARLLTDTQRILIFSGAGISTESGIPDFRGPSGVWKTVNPDDYTLANYMADAEFRKAAWKRRFDSFVMHALPNPAHQAVVDLNKAGLMIGCVTQNIDGLHQKAGLAATDLVELHGNASGIRCLECLTLADTDDVEIRWRKGESDPPCLACGGLLKTTVIYFGEMLPPDAIVRAAAWSAKADAVVAVGSSLSVYPAANVTLDVAAHNKPFVILNDGPTEQDDVATILLGGKAGVLLPLLVAELMGSRR